MNRIATLLDPDAGSQPPQTESETVLGYHLQAHNVSVSELARVLRIIV